LTGDSFGIAATYAAYKDVMSINHDMMDDEFYTQSLDRKYVVDWAIRFRAKSKKGVPYNTIAQFLLYLRKLGYPIAKITGDKPSITVLQDLHILGFDTAYMSVDTSRQPYITFMQKMYDGSIVCCKNPVLTKELIHLRDDGDKIDHPKTFPDGTPGSKDIADGVAGSFFNAFTNPVTIDEVDLATALINSNLGVDMTDDAPGYSKFLY
jgi:hypothetical protein